MEKPRFEVEDTEVAWHLPSFLNANVTGHALVWRNIWCPTDSFGRIPIYKRYYIQGNSNPVIAEDIKKLWPQATRITHHDMILIPDDPGRY